MSALQKLLAFTASLLIAASAQAGDYAARNIIGFSPDGDYFAFEEYGIEDGSGFPYTNLYILETATDKWLPKTPVRIRAQEGRPLEIVRKQALDVALPMLKKFGIGQDGYIAVHNPVTETSTNPHSVAFNPHHLLPWGERSYVISIDEYALPTDDCPDLGVEIKGFRMVLAGPEETRTLNEDKRVPSSRKCPLSYGISEIATFFPEGGGDPAGVVLLNVFSFGFEGPDRRFMAIAFRF